MKYKLSDCIDEIIDNRGRNPEHYYENEKYPVLDNYLIKNSLYPNLREVNRFINEDTFYKFLRNHLKIDDVIMTLVGNGISNVSLAPSENVVIIQNTIGFRPVESILLKRYLYYYFQYRKQDLINFNRGSSQPSIKKTDILDMEIDIPDISCQRKIESILSCIDEKIELNNKLNDNLEEMARLLFNDFFSDVTSRGKLLDVADIVMGQSPDGSSYNDEGKGEVFYQGRAEFGWRFPNRRLYTTEPKRMAREHSVLMSVRAPVGDINVANEKCCIGRGLAAISSKTGNQSFVFYLVDSLKSVLNIYNSEGTVFGSINKSSLENLEILLPTDKEICRFEQIVAPIDNKMRILSDEVITLSQIRDTLLPKLMAGEIDLNDISIDI